MNEGKESKMKASVFGRLNGDKASIVLVAALAAVVVYMTWVGASGQPLPQWLLWITTVL